MINEIIKSTIIGEDHLGDNLKKDCVGYLDNMEKHENNWNALKEYADHRLVSIQFEYENNIINEFEYVVRKNELLKLKLRIKNLEGEDENSN